MNEAYIKEILAGFDLSRYPEDFLKDFEAMECLAHGDAGETLLVKERATGDYFVAKCYFDNSLLSHATEGELLKSLHHFGLPNYVGEYKNERALCVVREYVEGTPLDQYVLQNGLSEEQAVLFSEQLCDILSYLHSQKPPVIHRDIKPQNIIVDAEGRIRLIDFGISRVYDEEAQEDTVCFGTKNFAAPEQYGYCQTDCRSDIFSMGILIGWLVTGETNLKNVFKKTENPRLKKIIQKCTAFAPEKRYASAEKVKSELVNADAHRRKSIFRWTCALLACAVCFAAGLVAGQNINILSAFSASSGVSFDEPLIEQAVRMELDKADGEPIEEKELLSVTELFIYGDRPADGYEAFEELANHMAQNDGAVRNGGISSLKDLAKLKNLQILHIPLQNISDLSYLSQLFSLEQIDLRHNPVQDVSSLKGLTLLKDLCLYGTYVSDLSQLSSCMMLESVDVGKTHVTSIAAFKGIDSLKSISIRSGVIKSLSGIEKFVFLERISIDGVDRRRHLSVNAAAEA